MTSRLFKLSASCAVILALTCSQSREQTIGSYDLGPITAQATPANSSHAAGVSIGGLFVVPLAQNVTNPSGILTSFFWKSVGGDTGAKVGRIWTKNPTNTTCTDNTNFAGSDTDDVFLITPPFSFTPAAPANTTGDSATYASVLGNTWDYKNSDSPLTKNLYVCVVTGATDTSDENKIVRVTLSGPQNGPLN